MKLINKFKDYLGNQYSNPNGLFGIYAGEKMVKQHIIETLWTIELLKLYRNEKVLELGCGAGNAMKLLLTHVTVNNVVGLDLSKSVLWSAANRNKNEIRKGRARLVQGNVNNLDFEDESFSKVFSIHSIYFWNSLSKTISEIYRVLKEDGLLVLTLCDGKDGESWNDTKNLIEQQVIPILRQNKFRSIKIIRGPYSRGYDTVAIKAEK